MRIRLVQTEGRAKEAIVEIDGHSLQVVDGFSPVGEPTAPGWLENVHLDAVTVEPGAGRPEPDVPADAVPGLRHIHGWRYLGWGHVVSLEPLCADLGVIELSLPGGGVGDLTIGDRVSVEIDRIFLRRA